MTDAERKAKVAAIYKRYAEQGKKLSDTDKLNIVNSVQKRSCYCDYMFHPEGC